MEEQKKERNKIIITGLFSLVLIIVLIGYTYSAFIVKDTDTTTITGTVASGNLGIVVNQLAPTEEYQNQGLVPQLDDYITSAVVGRNNLNCVDDNGNAVCQVYEVIVTNESNMTTKLDGLIRLNAANNPNLKWALLNGYTTGTKPTLKTQPKKHQITTMTANETFGANETKTYYLVTWISEQDEIQTDTGNFTGSVTFKASETSESSTTLYALGIAPNAETPDFTKTSCSSGCQENTVGVYSAPDDLGTSYYFRGDVENNYVYFSDLYWRIVRINGDGTIRIVYDGTSAHKNGEDTKDRFTENKNASIYNAQNYDASFVGYMNGTVDGVNFPNGTINSISYEEARTNNYNSTIKTYLEGEPNETNTGWYYNNIESKGNSIYVSDAIYCNDRSISETRTTIWNTPITNPGFGNNTTAYKFYDKVANMNNYKYFLCENKLDRFTKEETINNIEGNAKLKYPIALLTGDELAAAGLTTSEKNLKTYVYANALYYTMSPAYYINSSGYAYGAGVVAVHNGKLNTGKFSNACGVKPVISLKTNILNYGDGTIDNPFRIAE